MRIIIALIVVCASAGLARAEEWELKLAERPAPTRAFAEGSFAFQAASEYINGDAGFFGETVEAGVGSAAIGWYFKDDWGLYLEGAGYGFEQGESYDVFGGSIGVLLRWHFVNREKWSLFIDGGGGYVWFDDEFPDGGTHSNLIGKVGLGATYQFADNWHLVAGMRYFHLSNAARHGQEENPSIDGVEVYAGVIWTW